MKFVICAIRDRAVNAFWTPVFVPTEGAAIRGFSDQVNRKADDNMLYLHADDYDLFELGFYDDSTGAFEGHAPRQIAIGKSLKV